MKSIVKPGDIRTFSHCVKPEDAASFGGKTVHPVYATFALGRDAEWACRLFVLDMKDEDEEGIGTFLNIEHQSPALIGQEVVFTAKAETIHKNEIICSFEAKVGNRVIAQGKQGQKILKKSRVKALFESVQS